jgi:hypothetical protein
MAEQTYTEADMRALYFNRTQNLHPAEIRYYVPWPDALGLRIAFDLAGQATSAELGGMTIPGKLGVSLRTARVWWAGGNLVTRELRGTFDRASAAGHIQLTGVRAVARLHDWLAQQLLEAGAR